MIPPPDPLDHALKVFALIGGITTLLVFLAATAVLFMKIGGLKAIMLDAVSRLGRLETKVEDMKSEQDRALGREEAMSHVVPMHTQTLSGIGRR
jgi:hypothetical protein